MSTQRYGHPVVELALARTRELLREPEAVFWVFLFPVVFALVLSIAFRSQPPQPIPVAVLAGPAAEALRERLAASDDLELSSLGEPEARLALRSGKVALVVVAAEPLELWLDPDRREAREARFAVELVLSSPEPTGPASAGARRAPPLVRHSRDLGSRYIDFFVPGLLGMNLMGTGMWAVGFALVQQRSGGLLKRFVASPMRRWHFLAAQIVSRLAFLAAEATVLLGFAHYLLEVPVRGALVVLAGVAVLGAMTFVGLGLLIASRPKTIEGVSGLMNLVMVPMWACSGIFFSTERFPAAAQPFVQALPLTALNDALRGVMLDGAGVVALAPELAILALWATLSFAFALRLFRWQ
ncbi:MAG: ABC transporter permease [Thermoanaerobaculia bacterium]|nr:ABC transporter permease [Thermoanaerobaculia bacterium]